MRSHPVVVVPPFLDQHLGFPERVEHFAVQQLVAQLAVERFHAAVLPRAARLDERCLRSDARPHGRLDALLDAVADLAFPGGGRAALQVTPEEVVFEPDIEPAIRLAAAAPPRDGLQTRLATPICMSRFNARNRARGSTRHLA